MFVCHTVDITYQTNYFSMADPGVGRYLVALCVQGVVFIFLLFVIELQCVRTLWRVLTFLCRRRKQVKVETVDGWAVSPIPLIDTHEPPITFGCVLSHRGCVR